VIRYLTLNAVLELYVRVMARSGGLAGVRFLGALESALSQPRMTFGGEELYSSLVEKAAVLGFTLICNHPFIDGNKRIGHAAMEVFLVLNGQEIEASVGEQEQVILEVASGARDRESFAQWLTAHVRPTSRQNPGA